MFPVHAHRLSMGRGCGSVAVQRSSRRSQIFVVHADSIYIWYTFFHVTKETAANSYVMLTIICSDSYLKPWKNRLANRRKFLSTCTSFGRPLALTLVEPKLARMLTQVFHRLATQRRSTQVDRKSTVYAWNLVRLVWTFESTCKSVARPPIASLYASSGFANLRRLASPFGQLYMCSNYCFISYKRHTVSIV